MVPRLLLSLAFRQSAFGVSASRLEGCGRLAEGSSLILTGGYDIEEEDESTLNISLRK
jgi:hypothetical protein